MHGFEKKREKRMTTAERRGNGWYLIPLKIRKDTDVENLWGKGGGTILFELFIGGEEGPNPGKINPINCK